MTPGLSLFLILLSIVLIILFTSVLRYTVFLTLLLVSLLLAICTIPLPEVITVISTGFGNTMKSIGLIIILGIILGLLLERTGATRSIAGFLLRITGNRNPGMAMHLTGFITGIPIFCDSGFVVLSGINKSMAKYSGRSMAYMAPALASGLYAVHCLIPPHPGATAAAGIMGTNIGKLVQYGLPVALIAALSGFLWIRWIESRFPEPAKISDQQDFEKETVANAPAVFKSLLPIIVPLMLLTGRSAVVLIPDYQNNFLLQILSFTGEPVIALLTGILFALLLIGRSDFKTLNRLFDDAVEKAGPILAITAAGGIFGAVIKATGTGEWAGTHLVGTGLGIFIPFLLAAFLKTAQGSSTVAIITTASMFSPMLSALHLNTESGIIFSTLAMGAGSMIVSHTNDSYFWVITRFSDLASSDTLKRFTTTSFIMGCSSFAVIWILSRWML
jgi:gluconate:H+ symporter, GntP family